MHVPSLYRLRKVIILILSNVETVLPKSVLVFLVALYKMYTYTHLSLRFIFYVLKHSHSHIGLVLGYGKI